MYHDPFSVGVWDKFGDNRTASAIWSVVCFSFYQRVMRGEKYIKLPQSHRFGFFAFRRLGEEEQKVREFIWVSKHASTEESPFCRSRAEAVRGLRGGVFSLGSFRNAVVNSQPRPTSNRSTSTRGACRRKTRSPSTFESKASGVSPNSESNRRFSIIHLATTLPPLGRLQLSLAGAPDLRFAGAPELSPAGVLE
jgi:hypothetical protein